MAACHRVYDSRHMQADCQESGYGTLCWTVEYGLPLPFYSAVMRPLATSAVATQFIQLSEMKQVP